MHDDMTLPERLSMTGHHGLTSGPLLHALNSRKRLPHLHQNINMVCHHIRLDGLRSSGRHGLGRKRPYSQDILESVTHQALCYPLCIYKNLITAETFQIPGYVDCHPLRPTGRKAVMYEGNADHIKSFKDTLFFTDFI